ncbi:MAG: KEOPS complex subunit Cgi121 [Candidatus Micrarchaeota archaeon]
MVTLIGIRTKAKTSKELFSKLANLSKRYSILLQAFDPSTILSKRHIQHAYELSKRSFANKTNIARTREAELLLRAAATPKIDRAIEKIGVRNPKRIILFSPSHIPKSIVDEIGERDQSLLRLTQRKKNEIAKLFGIGKEKHMYSLEELLLERMALME